MFGGIAGHGAIDLVMQTENVDFTKACEIVTGRSASEPVDEARAERAIAMLKDLAADFQVIYLTTSDRYDAAADAVVELPGPTAKDDAPAELNA